MTRIASLPATLILLIAMLDGCSSARFYHNDPPLQFADVDYSFPTDVRQINGQPLAFHDAKNNGVPLLLLHGLASNAGFWRYNVPALEAAGYRVIAVDLPGYGKSGKAFSAPYGMKYYAETVVALLRELGIPNAVWMGHSMGGQIALTAALEYPQFVQRLVLVSPAGIEAFKRGEGDWLRNTVTPEFVIKTPQDRARANLVSNFYTWDERWEWMVEERVRMTRADGFDRFAYTVWRCVGAMLDEPVWQKLDRVAAPALIIGAEHDNLIPNPYLHGGRTVDVMEQGARAMKNATLVMIPSAGHMVQIEQASLVNAAVVGFLNGK